MHMRFLIYFFFLVDENILFTRACQSEVENILDILNLYQRALGQLINFDKLQLSFH